MSLGRWSVGRVTLVVSTWLVGSVAVSLYLAFRSLPPPTASGVSAVSFGIGETLLPVSIPALVFVVVWLIERHRETAKP